MENSKLNAGDLVKLKSGGPIMTVSAYEASGGSYLCQWFDDDELNDGFFSFDSLIRKQCEEVHRCGPNPPIDSKPIDKKGI
jgi:uncharacterized protein YodC (DUF2158 family)